MQFQLSTLSSNSIIARSRLLSPCQENNDSITRQEQEGKDSHHLNIKPRVNGRLLLHLLLPQSVPAFDSNESSHSMQSVQKPALLLLSPEKNNLPVDTAHHER